MDLVGAVVFCGWSVLISVISTRIHLVDGDLKDMATTVATHAVDQLILG